MRHKLDPLLRPKSIAVVGASPRIGALGNQVLKNLKQAGYDGKVFAINPKYDVVEDFPCFKDFDALPETVEHAIFAIGDSGTEAAFDAALNHGIKAATMASALMLDDDVKPVLKDRIAAKIQVHNLLVCGANCMGLFNFTDKVWTGGFETRVHRTPGNVALISQSGSGMSGILDTDARINFNFAVSTGQELSVTLEDYLDIVLDREETKVVGLFMETSRKPAELRVALEKANRRGIPIVVVKSGRTEFSARMATSHTGAMAGSDDAFCALFDRYGVIRVDDTNDLANTLILFAQPYPVGPGGLVSLHDSGGMRQLAIDLADKYSVPYASLSDACKNKLLAILDPGLPAENPLDNWGAGGPDFPSEAAEHLALMLAEPTAAIGAVMQDRNTDSSIDNSYIDYIRHAHTQTGKPVCFVSGHQGSGYDGKTISVTNEGFPVIDGFSNFIKAVGHVFAYRDFCSRDQRVAPEVDAALVLKWRPRLETGTALGEHEASAMVRDFGIPASPAIFVQTENDAVKAAHTTGYPVVLKTAEDGINHKSDKGGVFLNVNDGNSVRAAYDKLKTRLGPKVLVAPMVQVAGTEMILGMLTDPHFGPVVAIGIGGIHTEILKDIAFALPPFSADEAKRLILKLKLAPLLKGQRGAMPADIDAFATAAANFSAMVYALGDHFEEIDLNPVKVMEKGCIALDALIVPTQGIPETRRAI